MKKNDRPLIAISACLLGEPVRYNKGNTADKWIIRELSQFVNFYPVCPEVAMGLGTPREEIQLYYNHRGEIKVRSKHSRNDLTELAKSTYIKMNEDFGLHNIDGFILMRRSPSCGLENVKTVNEKQDLPIKRSKGLFAKNIEYSFPIIPKIDSGRLKNIELREIFIKSVYAHFRFKKIELKTSALQKFHRQYKYILMDHCQDSLRILGRIVANHENKTTEDMFKDYQKIFFDTLSKNTSIKNRTNTLHHLLGYLKNYLTRQEKIEILNYINDYKTNIQNYLVPFNILYYLIKKHDITYLKNQYLFSPYPKNLKLHMTT